MNADITVLAEEGLKDDKTEVACIVYPFTLSYVTNRGKFLEMYHRHSFFKRDITLILPVGRSANNSLHRQLFSFFV
jgi:hypothetical protein